MGACGQHARVMAQVIRGDRAVPRRWMERRVMASWYDAFLLRYWRYSSGEHRLTVEHIGSGRRIVVASLAAALAWIESISTASSDRIAEDMPDEPPDGTPNSTP